MNIEPFTMTDHDCLSNQTVNWHSFSCSFGVPAWSNAPHRSTVHWLSPGDPETTSFLDIVTAFPDQAVHILYSDLTSHRLPGNVVFAYGIPMFLCSCRNPTCRIWIYTRMCIQRAKSMQNGIRMRSRPLLLFPRGLEFKIKTASPCSKAWPQVENKK